MNQEQIVRREQFIIENKPKWKKAGSKHRLTRQSLKVTLAELAESTGFSATKLGSFEHGFPITHRKAVEKSYKMALQAKLNEIQNDFHSQLGN